MPQQRRESPWLHVLVSFSFYFPPISVLCLLEMLRESNRKGTGICAGEGQRAELWLRRAHGGRKGLQGLG